MGLCHTWLDELGLLGLEGVAEVFCPHACPDACSVWVCVEEGYDGLEDASVLVVSSLEGVSDVLGDLVVVVLSGFFHVGV